ERRCPEPWSVADGHAAGGVDHGERPDADAVSGLRSTRPETALEIGRRGAESGTDAAQCKIIACRARGGVGEIAVGREAPPCLVAAVEQIEGDRTWSDRNARLANWNTGAILAKPGLYAARGVQPERRAAGQR